MPTTKRLNLYPLLEARVLARAVKDNVTRHIRINLATGEVQDITPNPTANPNPRATP